MRYPVIIEPTSTGYSAYSPDVSGCRAAGDTVEETRLNYQEALASHFEACREVGELIPRPSSFVAYVQIPKAARKVRNAQEALACGEAFQRLAERLLPDIWKVEEGSHHLMPDEMGDVVSCATNLAFGVELYLKGLLTHLGLDVPTSHNLRGLYDALPQSVRALIESIFDKALPGEVQRLGGRVSFSFAKGPLKEPCWNDYKVSLALPDMLKRSKDLFVSWRYVFEFSPSGGSLYQFRQFEYGLLRCAAEVLRVELTARLHETGEGALPSPPGGY